jgi:glycosyltransferase involved in cell wall biosynthesis
MKRLAYLMGTFPALTETFVLGEIEALGEAGVKVDLYSLRRPRTAHDRSQGEAMAAQTRYGLSLGRRALWAANLRVFAKAPRRYLGALASVAGRTALNPIHCLKSLGLFPVAAAFADAMARDGVEHVHAHWANYPATAAYVVARILGIPFSVTAHVYDATLVRSLMREKIRRARFVVTCNAWSAERLARLTPEARARIILNYHGVTLERFDLAGCERTAGAPCALRIFSCGSLYPRKGFPVLLEACRRLRDRGRAFQCTILGEGPERARLERFVADHDLSSCVTLLGAQPHRDVLRQYRQADLFVLACMTDYLGWRDLATDPLLVLEVGLAIPFRPITDGIPNVLVEAMAMGLPVVSTTVAGVPELVEHGHTGLLVPEQDPAALALAIERLMDDPGLRATMGARARLHVSERFDRRKNIQDLVRILDPSAVNGAPGAKGILQFARS